MANEKLIGFSEVKKKLTAIRQYFSGYPSTDQDKLARAVVKMCIEEVDKLQPVDAVEVVRCKDCASYGGTGWCCVHDTCMEENDFCSYGERRTDG